MYRLTRLLDRIIVDLTNILKKKTILIDLDGVLNNYKGNFDINEIPSIKSGAREFLIELSKDFDIKLFTTRNKILASKWIVKEKLDNIITDITDRKELCFLFVDDRCINFSGDYGNLIKEIKNFKPWYRK